MSHQLPRPRPVGADRLILHARRRASKDCRQFALSPEDLVIPKACPVFGFPLGESSMTAPELTLIEHDGDYVPENALVWSRSANGLRQGRSLFTLQVLEAETVVPRTKYPELLHSSYVNARRLRAMIACLQRKAAPGPAVGFSAFLALTDDQRADLILGRA